MATDENDPQFETWKAISGYEGRYDVSDQGRVKSHPLRIVRPDGGDYIHPLSGRILRQAKSRRRYHTVTLHRDNGRKSAWVHALVCEAFHGPREPGMEVLHKDGNPENNAASNLRWGTHKENLQDAVRHGVIRRGEKSGRAKLTDAQIQEMRELYKQGALTWKSAACRYGIHKHYAWKVLNDKARVSARHCEPRNIRLRQQGVGERDLPEPCRPSR